MEKKIHRLNLRVSDELKDFLEVKSFRSQKSISDIIREYIRLGILKEKNLFEVKPIRTKTKNILTF